MILIGEIQKLTRHAPFLQDVKEHNAFGFGKTVVEGVMNDEVRSCPVFDVIDGIPALVVITVVPEGAVELERT